MWSIICMHYLYANTTTKILMQYLNKHKPGARYTSKNKPQNKFQPKTAEDVLQRIKHFGLTRVIKKL